MATGLILAKTADTDRLNKGDSGKELDDLPTFRHLHLAPVPTAEDRKTDLAALVLRHKFRCRSQQGQPQIKVVPALPIFAPDTSWNMTSDAQSKSLIRLSDRTIPIS